MQLPDAMLLFLAAVAGLAATAPSAVQAQTAPPNLALSGTAYRWAHNGSATSNANRAAAPVLNDGSPTYDVDLSGGTGESRAAFQAAGIVWATPQTLTQVAFVNGAWQSTGDGAFCADMRLQTSADGTTWADTDWKVAPAYAYGPAAAGVTYRFVGAATTARGIRVVGRARCTTQASYWANVREVQAFDTRAAAATSVWTDAAVPAIVDVADGNAVELGVRFRASVNGQVTGIRFYKSAANTGTHTGSLWTAQGALLARGSFSRETASGWQQLSFAAPVAISANTTYVASYNAPAGHYSANSRFFADGSHTSGTLQALQSGTDGSGNGVYRYSTTPVFPDQTWNATNYWVDVLFVPAAASADRTPPTVPAALRAIADASGGVTLTWGPSTDNVGVVKYQVLRNGVATPVAEPTGTSFTDTAVVPGTAYTYQVRALDAAGNASALSQAASAVPVTPTRLFGWQLTQTNVGLAPHGLSCESLPLYQGSAKPAAGTTIRRQRITVPLDLSNGNILIDQSCIRPSGTGYHNSFLVTTTLCEGGECRATAAGNVVIRDSEIDAEHLPNQTIAGSCAFLGVGTLERNYMHGMGSGICFFETGPTHSARAEQNYVRGLRSWGDPSQPNGSHNEAATIRDFRDAPGRLVSFINNRLDCSGGNETGGLFIQPTWLPIHNVFIEGNYLEGGGFNLYLERTGNASYGNVNAVNNRFRPTGWGPAATPSGPGYTTWRDNHRFDATQPEGKGAVVMP